MGEQDHKVAIITGGSQGIGAGLVAGYRRQGWAVVANALTIKPADDPEVLTVEGDVAEAAAADRISRRRRPDHQWGSRSLTRRRRALSWDITGGSHDRHIDPRCT